MESITRALEIPVTEIEMDEEPFARGGFGKVYRAKWHESPIVVKVIKAETERDRDDIIIEAVLTIRLSHPNVIKLFGITRVSAKRLGIVMEKAEHESLDKWIGQIDRDKQTKIALGIIDGLMYVHSQKVIQRYQAEEHPHVWNRRRHDSQNR